MLSTDTTWEVVQSFLNVPGMKGVALIDGRSRPYFQGIERVLNSQQREALAEGVWQVLETIPDDFESFEFQFSGTQVYIHKLSQDQILLVLTHDNLIYPDYFDAFSRLRGAFNEDSSATMDAFQRLLGARNTKVTPLNLSDVANAEDEAPSPVNTLGADEAGLEDSSETFSQEPPTLEIPTLEIPSGSADYAVAADTEITDISTAAVEPDAPANPVPDDDDLPATVLLDIDDEDDAPALPDFAATEAGLPDLDGVDGSLPDFGGPDAVAPEVPVEVPTTDAGSPSDGNAAALFAASLADANDLVGRSSSTKSDSTPSAGESSGQELEKAMELPSLDGDDVASESLPEIDSLLAVTQPPSEKPMDAAATPSSADPQADLAALVDTLSLGEEDFESQSGLGSVTAASANVAGEAADVALPDMELSREDGAEATGLPEVEAEAAEVLNPWDEPDAAAAAVSEALAESQEAGQAQVEQSQDEPLLAVTQPPSAEQQESVGIGSEAAERSLNNRLDAVALDDDIEIDDLFGYEEPAAEKAPPKTSHAVLESYVESLNALGEFSAHYLGRAVIVNYWRTSRPGDEWLQGAFAIERSANSIRLGPDYAASRRSPITDGQQVALQTWAGQFVSRCSKVIRDFPQLAQQSLDEDQSKMLDL